MQNRSEQSHVPVHCCSDRMCSDRSAIMPSRSMSPRRSGQPAPTRRHERTSRSISRSRRERSPAPTRRSSSKARNNRSSSRARSHRDKPRTSGGTSLSPVGRGRGRSSTDSCNRSKGSDSRRTHTGTANSGSRTPPQSNQKSRTMRGEKGMSPHREANTLPRLSREQVRRRPGYAVPSYMLRNQTRTKAKHAIELLQESSVLPAETLDATKLHGIEPSNNIRPAPRHSSSSEHTSRHRSSGRRPSMISSGRPGERQTRRKSMSDSNLLGRCRSNRRRGQRSSHTSRSSPPNELDQHKSQHNHGSSHHRSKGEEDNKRQNFHRSKSERLSGLPTTIHTVQDGHFPHHVPRTLEKSTSHHVAREQSMHRESTLTVDVIEQGVYISFPTTVDGAVRIGDDIVASHDAEKVRRPGAIESALVPLASTGSQRENDDENRRNYRKELRRAKSEQLIGRALVPGEGYRAGFHRDHKIGSSSQQLGNSMALVPRSTRHKRQESSASEEGQEQEDSLALVPKRNGDDKHDSGNERKRTGKLSLHSSVKGASRFGGFFRSQSERLFRKQAESDRGGRFLGSNALRKFSGGAAVRHSPSEAGKEPDGIPKFIVFDPHEQDEGCTSPYKTNDDNDALLAMKKRLTNLNFPMPEYRHADRQNYAKALPLPSWSSHTSRHPPTHTPDKQPVPRTETCLTIFKPSQQETKVPKGAHTLYREDRESGSPASCERTYATSGRASDLKP